MKANYKFDFETNAIVVNRGFYEMACIGGTDEHKELVQLQHDYPNMRIVPKRARITSTRKRRSGGITYQYMRTFIAIMDPDNLKTFERTKMLYSELWNDSTTVFWRMKEWFLDTYPQHDDMIYAAVPRVEVKALEQAEIVEVA